MCRRLHRNRQWGYWFLSFDEPCLVYDGKDGPRNPRYDVGLSNIHNVEDAIKLLQKVIAEKLGWMTQRYLDDLRRALRELCGYDIPEILLATEPALGHQEFFRNLGGSL